jgi:hypothetical protein
MGCATLNYINIRFPSFVNQLLFWMHLTYKIIFLKQIIKKQNLSNISYNYLMENYEENMLGESKNKRSILTAIKVVAWR